MKIVKPFLINCKCQFRDCKEKATAIIYGRRVCCFHYKLSKIEFRRKRENVRNSV